MNNVMQVGNIVITSYGTGPYEITEVTGPCSCPDYISLINNCPTQSEPHFHAVCKGMDGHEKGDTFWLNGIRADGTSVWSESLVSVIRYADQMSFLF